MSGKSGPRTRLLLLRRRRLRVPALSSAAAGAAAAASWIPRVALYSKDASGAGLRRAAAAASTATAGPPISVDAPADGVGKERLMNVWALLWATWANKVIFFCHTRRICCFIFFSKKSVASIVWQQELKSQSHDLDLNEVQGCKNMIKR